MAYLKIELNDINNSIIDIKTSTFSINYIHIKKLIFRDILIFNNKEYKYNNRTKLLEDIKLLKEIEYIFNIPTILKFENYNRYKQVCIKDIVLMDNKEHMFPLKRVYNKVFKKEWTVISSRFSLPNILLYTNDKTYRKKLSSLRRLIKLEYIYIYDKESLNDFKLLIKNIVKIKYKKDMK
jgi:hypothetical protein